MSKVENLFGDEYVVDEDGFLVDGVIVELDLVDIVDMDLGGFLDRISDEAGFPLMMAQEYVIESHNGNTLSLRIKGDVSADIERQAR